MKAYYGIDAPNDVIRFALIGLAGTASGYSLIAFAHKQGFGSALFSIGFWFLLTAVVMVYSSLFGKKLTRNWLLAQHKWRGDEQVLDAGCGRGLMLLGAAKKLQSGRAVGIDLWQSVDQSGNVEQATRDNARAEGVAEKIDIQTGDIRQLPFDASSFDVVTSSFVVHNIAGKEERAKALREFVRVLKPGGQLLFVDIFHGSEYAKVLREAGMEVRLSFPTLLFMLPTFKIIATKRGF